MVHMASDLPAPDAPFEHVGGQVLHLLVELGIGVRDHLFAAGEVLEGDAVGLMNCPVFHQLPERPVGGEGLRRGVGPAVGEQPLQWAGDDASAFIITHS